MGSEVEILGFRCIGNGAEVNILMQTMFGSA